MSRYDGLNDHEWNMILKDAVKTFGNIILKDLGREDAVKVLCEHVSRMNEFIDAKETA